MSTELLPAKWRSAGSPPPRRGKVAGSLVLAVLVAIEGCVVYRPRPLSSVPFRDRAEVQERGGLRVTVAVPSEEEAKRIFGVPTYRAGIQPVWLEIENGSRDAYMLLKAGIDPGYYPPAEAAWANHYGSFARLVSYGILSIAFLPLLVPASLEAWRASRANRAMNETFEKEGFREVVLQPGTTSSGFVFTTTDPGTKHVHVPLLGPHSTERFDFYVTVPGITVDYDTVDFEYLYPPDEILDVEDEAGFRSALEDLPCCTTGVRGAGGGDPLNVVLVGDGERLLQALIRARWDETEIVDLGSILRTVRSFLFRTRYRVSPVSNLYVYGRKQDAAFQKARETIQRRNHFRLWLAPFRYRGDDVWVGAATRDIGVRITPRTWTLTTHAIDGDVDDARDYLAIDLIEETKRVLAVAFAPGVGKTERERPRRNLTGDPWWTDGLRVVIFLGDGEVDRPDLLDWDDRVSAKGSSDSQNDPGRTERVDGSRSTVLRADA